jgi:hypothetical protein
MRDIYYSATDIHTLRDCGETHHTCDNGTVKHMTGESKQMVIGVDGSFLTRTVTES